MIKNNHWKLLHQTSQVTEVLSWLGDRSPIKLATSDHLTVIQRWKNSSKNHRQLFRPHLGSSLWYTSMMVNWMTALTNKSTTSETLVVSF